MEDRRISVDEVRTRQERGEELLFLDCRNPQAWAESDVTIPNALRVDAHNIERSLPQIPRDATIISYCT